jgi:23S rRNA (uracil1939-C5)-methyltransferase
VSRDQAVIVEVTGLAPGGDAVGRQRGGEADGRVTFVPLAAPGELVRARLVRAKARVAWAELEEVLERSPARVEPPCGLFGRCGGCQWQHVDRATQLEAKGAIASRALGLELGAARAVGPDYGYRERARLVVGDAPAAGRAPIGFFARRTRDVIDVPACPLLSPALAAALPLVRAAAVDAAAGALIPLQAGRDGVVMAELGGRGLRVVTGSGAPGALEPIDAGDEGKWPDVAEPGSRSLRVPAGAFAQVGSAGNAALVEAVREAVGKAPGRTLELYAGSGNFTRHLVEVATAVIATDGDAGAVERGRHNVPEADWRTAVDAAGLGVPVETVLVDPPRQGLDDRHLALVRLARRQLVYVSCDPQTLARDAQRLAGDGFRLTRAVALDLMPQTYHVEVVALFLR